MSVILQDKIVQNQVNKIEESTQNQNKSIKQNNYDQDFQNELQNCEKNLNDSEIDKEMKLERIDNTGIFLPQSKNYKNKHSDPLFVQLLQKKNKTPDDEMRIFERIKSLDKLKIFIEEVLKGLDTTRLVQLFSKTQYKKYQSGEVVFKQGDKSNGKLYIILQGSVMLFIKNVVNFEQEEQNFKDKKNELKPTISKVDENQMMGRFYQVSNQKGKQKLEQQPIYQKKQNKKKNKKKNEEKKANQENKKGVWDVPLFIVLKMLNIVRKFRNKQFNLHKRVLDREQQNILGKQYGNGKKKILTTGHIFGEFALLNDNSRSATIIIDRNPVMFRQGEYITVDVNQTNIKDMQYNQDNETVYMIEEGEVILEKEVTVQGEYPFEKFTKKEIVNITKLGIGSMVGDELLTKKNDKYLFTSRCYSQKAVLLKIRMGILRRRFPKEIIRDARKLFKIKYLERLEMLKNQKAIMEADFNNGDYLQQISNQSNQVIDRTSESKYNIMKIDYQKKFKFNQLFFNLVKIQELNKYHQKQQILQLKQQQFDNNNQKEDGSQSGPALRKYEYDLNSNDRIIDGEVVLKQGDRSNGKLYIILSGSVMLFIKNVVNFEHEEQKLKDRKNQLIVNENQMMGHFYKVQNQQVRQKLDIKKQIKKYKNNEKKRETERKEQVQLKLQKKKGTWDIPLLVFLKMLHVSRKIRDNQFNLNKNVLDREQQQILEKQYGNGKKKVLTSGNIFGEFALLNDNNRSATIVIDREDTELLTIDKKDFQESIDNLKDLLSLRKSLILQNFPKTNMLSPGSQIEMLYSFEPIIFSQGEYITIDVNQSNKKDFQYNQDNQTVYMIQEGEVVLEKEVTVQGEYPFEKSTKKEIINITKLGVGSIVGDELLNKKNTGYFFTSKCYSQRAILLRIRMGVLFRRFPKEIIKGAINLYKIKHKERMDILEKKKAVFQAEFNKFENILKLQNKQVVDRVNEVKIQELNKFYEKKNWQQFQQKYMKQKQTDDNNPQSSGKLNTNSQNKKNVFDWEDNSKFLEVEKERVMKFMKKKDLVINNKQENFKIQIEQNKKANKNFGDLIVEAQEKVADKLQMKLNFQLEEQYQKQKDIENFTYDFGKLQVKKTVDKKWLQYCYKFLQNKQNSKEITNMLEKQNQCFLKNQNQINSQRKLLQKNEIDWNISASSDQKLQLIKNFNQKQELKNTENSKSFQNFPSLKKYDTLPVVQQQQLSKQKDTKFMNLFGRMQKSKSRSSKIGSFYQSATKNENDQSQINTNCEYQQKLGQLKEINLNKNNIKSLVDLDLSPKNRVGHKKSTFFTNIKSQISSSNLQLNNQKNIQEQQNQQNQLQREKTISQFRVKSQKEIKEKQQSLDSKILNQVQKIPLFRIKNESSTTNSNQSTQRQNIQSSQNFEQDYCQQDILQYSQLQESFLEKVQTKKNVNLNFKLGKNLDNYRSSSLNKKQHQQLQSRLSASNKFSYIEKLFQNAKIKVFSQSNQNLEENKKSNQDQEQNKNEIFISNQGSNDQNTSLEKLGKFSLHSGVQSQNQSNFILTEKEILDEKVQRLNQAQNRNFMIKQAQNRQIQRNRNTLSKIVKKNTFLGNGYKKIFYEEVDLSYNISRNKSTVFGSNNKNNCSQVFFEDSFENQKKQNQEQNNLSFALGSQLSIRSGSVRSTVSNQLDYYSYLKNLKEEGFGSSTNADFEQRQQLNNFLDLEKSQKLTQSEYVSPKNMDQFLSNRNKNLHKNLSEKIEDMLAINLEKAQSTKQVQEHLNMKNTFKDEKNRKLLLEKQKKLIDLKRDRDISPTLLVKKSSSNFQDLKNQKLKKSKTGYQYDGKTEKMIKEKYLEQLTKINMLQRKYNLIFDDKNQQHALMGDLKSQFQKITDELQKEQDLHKQAMENNEQFQNQINSLEERNQKIEQEKTQLKKQRDELVQQENNLKMLLLKYDQMQKEMEENKNIQSQKEEEAEKMRYEMELKNKFIEELNKKQEIFQMQMNQLKEEQKINLQNKDIEIQNGVEYIQQYKNKNQQLQEENQDLLGEINQIKEEFKQFKDQNVQNQIESYEKQLKQLQEQIEQKNKIVLDLEENSVQFQNSQQKQIKELEEQNERFQQELVKKQQEIDTLNTNNKNFRRQNSVQMEEIQSENEKLTKMYEEKIRQIQDENQKKVRNLEFELNQNNQQLLQQLEEEQKLYENQGKQIQNLENQLQDKKDKFKIQQEKMNELENLVKSERGEKNAKIQEKQEIQTENERLQKELGQVQQKIKEFQEVQQENQETISQQKKEIEEMKQINQNQLEQQMEQHDVNTEELKKQFEEFYGKQIEQLENQVKENNIQKEQLKQNIVNQESQIQEKDEEIQKLKEYKHKLAEFKEKCEDLEEIVQKLKGDMEENNRIIEEKQGKENDLKNQIQELQDQLKLQKQQMEIEKKQIQQENNEKQKNLEQQQQLERDQQQEEIQQWIERLQGLEKQMREGEEQYEELELQFESEKKQFLEENDELKNQIKEFKQNIDEKENLIKKIEGEKKQVQEKFQAEMEEKINEIGKKSEKLELLQKEIESLKASDNEKNEQIYSLKREINSFQDKVMENERQVQVIEKQKSLLEESLGKKEQEIQNLILKIDGDRNEVEEKLKSQLQEQKQSYQKKLLEEKRKKEDLNLENQENKEKVLAFEQKFQEIQSNLKEMESQREEEIEGLKQKSQKLEKELKNYREKEQDIIETHKNQIQIYQGIQEENQAQIQQLKQALQMKEIELEEFQHLRNQLDEVSQCNISLQQQNQELEFSYKRQISELEDKTSEQVKLSQLMSERKIKDYTKKIEEFENENVFLKQELENLRNQSQMSETSSQIIRGGSFGVAGVLSPYMNQFNRQSLGDSGFNQLAQSERLPRRQDTLQSEQSINSNRSKEDTKKLYSKLTQMGSIAASMMSNKLDYSSLREMSQRQSQFMNIQEINENEELDISKNEKSSQQNNNSSNNKNNNNNNNNNFGGILGSINKLSQSQFSGFGLNQSQNYQQQQNGSQNGDQSLSKSENMSSQKQQHVYEQIKMELIKESQNQEIDEEIKKLLKEQQMYESQKEEVDSQEKDQQKE
ncbi:Cyclic nucleotide-binding protein [Pseudocohnilembus persalinus]|uniref:Cyclic nucleotide-binding protein n=1 Tax=Pseudocohnilembus persalinus TaxID=266149 RepID=A0A0V0QTI5_PSEPJ|nr:Cyclic nucleotide-binding protein [Pseudocohnilembus persalinus]|eukprot:KRX05566.1 Cyclic nucleotide-binding protein [Pseudocohnilembus persalinus]